jgi:hypothetical protein
MTTTLDRRQMSPRRERPAQGRVLNRLVGAGFAAAGRKRHWDDTAGTVVSSVAG